MAVRYMTPRGGGRTFRLGDGSCSYSVLVNTLLRKSFVNKLGYLYL